MPLAQHLGMAGNMPPPSEKLFRWFSIAKKYVEENGTLQVVAFF